MHNQASPFGRQKQALAPREVEGKRILVTGGAAKEIIDGVRHYANIARPEDHGHLVAAALREQGASVTLVTCKTKLAGPKDVGSVSTRADRQEIVSGSDLAACCADLCGSQKFDIILHLASIPSLKPAFRAAHKLKVKTAPGEPVTMDVTANEDLLSALHMVGKDAVVAGYDNRQRFQAGGLPSSWRSFVEGFLHGNGVVVRAPRQPSPQPKQDLAGKKVIVSSGPVVETLTTCGDVITNFSSGLQGHEIACALADRGAEVALVAGPVTLPDPVHPSIRTVPVRSAREMLSACMDELPATAYVGVAAVADFGVSEPLPPDFEQDRVTSISLIQNPDILASIGKHETKRPSVVIGFAAETRDLEVYARQKLEKKGADAIFANLVGDEAKGRDSNRNHVLRVTKYEGYDCGETDKYQVGLLIADFIASHSGNLKRQGRKMTEKKKLVLVVSGSIAACKTADIVYALQNAEYAVDVIFTKTAEQWQDKPRWIPIETVRQAAKGSVLTDSDPFEAKNEIVQKADVLLVAPASADFISQLTYGASDLARALLDARQGGKALCVAPAMNYKMWEHPTVQRNCAYMVKQGVTFLGPVEGVMACGDYGFGRMMQVDALVDSLHSILIDMNDSSSVLYEMARQAASTKIASKRSPSIFMLAVVAGEDIQWGELEAFVAAANAEGLSSSYVLDQKWQGHKAALEKLTGQTVVTDHYQIDPEGLEHIRMTDQASYVVFPFVDAKLAQRLLEGASKALSTDIYLASKAPVVLIPSTRSAPDEEVLSALRKDGIRVVKNLQELKR